jgi:DNA (cytosine-5)-methyltransferase 1
MPQVEDAVQLALSESRAGLAENFRREEGRLVREIRRPDGSTALTSLPDLEPTAPDQAAAFEYSWLRSRTRPEPETAIRTLRCADLFSGVGGLSTGLHEAAWSLDLDVDHVFAGDFDRVLLDTYEQNFHPEHLQSGPLESVVDGEVGARLTPAERALERQLGSLDLVLAGPPCQGNSDLNNHTRRDDPRNALLLRVVRFAEICRPRSILIENVPGVLRDRGDVVAKAKDQLERLGYQIDAGVIRADELGVPQSRRRFFLLASRAGTPSIVAAVARGRRPPRPVTWAIDDLGETGESVFESSASHSTENRRRIAYLFDQGLYDLPDSERPPCHREKRHSYQAVYGRMRPDRPAPTITVGFGSTGQGRFVHPNFPRTLTPHEAARVQSFPDWFDFGRLQRRGQLQKAIGNAVPPRMASVLVRELLGLMA